MKDKYVVGCGEVLKPISMVFNIPSSSALCVLYFRAVSFDNTSPANLAMVIYEWKDVKYLGKTTTSTTDEDLPVSLSIPQVHI